MRLAVDQWGKVEALEGSTFQAKVRPCCVAFNRELLEATRKQQGPSDPYTESECARGLTCKARPSCPKGPPPKCNCVSGHVLGCSCLLGRLREALLDGLALVCVLLAGGQQPVPD